jgi:hypothetical protein
MDACVATQNARGSMHCLSISALWANTACSLLLHQPSSVCGCALCAVWYGAARAMLGPRWRSMRYFTPLPLLDCGTLHCKLRKTEWSNKHDASQCSGWNEGRRFQRARSAVICTPFALTVFAHLRIIHLCDRLALLLLLCVQQSLDIAL